MRRRNVSTYKTLTAIVLLCSVILSGCAGESGTSSNTGNRGTVDYAKTQPMTTSNSTTTAATNTNAPGIYSSNDEYKEESTNGERYAEISENPFLETVRAPLSTFSIDVDTASYANVRRFLNEGQLPPKDAVRIEELINYFEYDYPQPEGDLPFSVNTEVAACPWNTKHEIVQIGLQGRKVSLDNVPPSNLVFLVDVSGSMNSPDKLPLLKQGLKTMVNQLSYKDRVAIVVYAGASGLALPSTSADDKRTITGALDNLEAGGSTNGGQGIRLAYQRQQSRDFGNRRRFQCRPDGRQRTCVINRTKTSKQYLSVCFGFRNGKSE